MRKRWKVNIMLYGFTWFVVGMVLWMALTALTNPCDEGGCGLDATGIGTVPLIGLVVWLAPLVVPATIAGVVVAVRALWVERPRRVIEPVLQDLRTTERGK